MRFVVGEPSKTHHSELNLGWLDRIFLRRQRRADSANIYMFNEDFSRIFRYSGRRSKSVFNIETNDKELVLRLLGNLRGSFGQRSLEDTVFEFASKIAQALVVFGRAIYYIHDDDEKEKTYISSYNSEGLFYIYGFVIQYLPERIQRAWDLGDVDLPRELRLLDIRKTLRFELPNAIRRKIRAQNKVLSSLDRYGESIPLRLRPQVTLENPNPKVDFDFQRWRGVRDLVLHVATRETGWNARVYGSEKKSDFFDCHRHIRFRRNQLMLRDHILEQLGIELSRVGRYYRKNFRIEISSGGSLLSVAELDDLEARLLREEAGFSEVIDSCFKP